MEAWTDRGYSRQLFRLAAEGFGTSTVQSRLYRENIPSPKGARIWQGSFIKRVVMNDLYLPYTYEETLELVSPTVAATLDPEEEYGIRWWNRISKRDARFRKQTETDSDAIVNASPPRRGTGKNG